MKYVFSGIIWKNNLEILTHIFKRSLKKLLENKIRNDIRDPYTENRLFERTL